MVIKNKKIPNTWDLKRIGDLGEIVTGSTPNTNVDEYWNGDIPFVSPTDMKGTRYIKNTERTVTYKGAQVGRIIPKNSVMVTCIASIGKLAISSQECITNQQINTIIPYKDYNHEFLYYAISNQIPYFQTLAGTTAVPIINKKTFSNVSIPVPPINEQHKIAAILSSVDEAIEKTEAIIEQTEKVKKGLMQQLLTKGIGHTKFKKTEIGEIPEEWEVKRLSEISLINMGQSPSSAVCNDLGEGIPFFQGNAEFGMKHPIPKRWCTEPTKLANKGDILISVRAPVGELNIANQTCCIGRGLAAITPTKINNDYLYFAMQVYKSSLLKVSQGSTFTAINKQDLHNLLLPVPSLIEQKKISAILLSLDSKFEKEKKKLNQLQFMKTGLMQVLLTGKVRVKVDEDEVMSS